MTTQGLAWSKLSGTCTAITTRLRPLPSSSEATYSVPGIRPSEAVTAPAVVMLGHAVWTHRYGSDSAVIGPPRLVRPASFRNGRVSPNSAKI